MRNIMYAIVAVMCGILFAWALAIVGLIAAVDALDLRNSYDR